MYREIKVITRNILIVVIKRSSKLEAIFEPFGPTLGYLKMFEI